MSDRVDRRAAQQVADAAADGLRERIEPTLAAGATWAKWLKQNRATLVDMATTGMTSAAIIDAHQRESEAVCCIIRSMRLLQSRLELPRRPWAGPRTSLN